jgi:hypothetical protein
MKSNRSLISFALICAAALFWAPRAFAYSQYWDSVIAPNPASCGGCHGAAPASTSACNGCHHHMNEGSLSGTVTPASVAAGGTVTATVNVGSTAGGSGYFGIVIVDAAGNIVAKSNTGALNPVPALSASSRTANIAIPAGTPAGTYTVGWYGNAVQYGSGSPNLCDSYSTCVIDPNNAVHATRKTSAVFTVTAPPPPAAPVATLSPTSVAITAGVGASANGTATLTNTGGGTLTVSGITACTGTTPPFTVAPSAIINLAASASQALTVTFAPTSAGTFTGCFNIATNDTAHPTVTLNLTGNATSTVVPPTATLSKTSLAITAAVGASATGTATLTNAGGGTLTVGGITACAGTTPPFTISPDATTPINLAATAGQTFTVTFAPTSAGPFTGCFNIATNDTANSTVTINVTGNTTAVTVPPTARLAQTSLTIAAASGSSASGTTTLSNTGGSTLTIPVGGITACSNTSPPFSIAPNAQSAAINIAPGDSQMLTVAFKPYSSGTFTGCYKIKTNDPAQPTLTLNLTGNASGSGGHSRIYDRDSLMGIEHINMYKNYGVACGSCHDGRREPGAPNIGDFPGHFSNGTCSQCHDGSRAPAWFISSMTSRTTRYSTCSQCHAVTQSGGSGTRR